MKTGKNGGAKKKPSASSIYVMANLYVAELSQASFSEKENAKLETLKEYLTSYDFSENIVLEKKVKTTIKEYEALPPKEVKAKKTKSALKKKAEPDTPPPKFESREYEEVEFGLDVAQGAKKKTQTVAITLEELREELGNPHFITDFASSLSSLMGAKVKLYRKRWEETKREHEAITKKVVALRATGASPHDIKEMYPGYTTLTVYLVDLEELIGILEKKADTVTEEDVAVNLLEAIDNTSYGLASLVGRNDVKNDIASKLYAFSKGYKTFLGSFNNMVIMGQAGVGKTHVAKAIGYVFSKSGILAKNVVKIVTRVELVGQYIGHTAPRTRSVLMETLEGILFIDEAYQLTHSKDAKGGYQDFGAEAMTEIVNFLDKFIGMNMVIVAGYEDVMKKDFLTFNEGIPRRFPHRIVLESYSTNELSDILIWNLKQKIPPSVEIDDEVCNWLYTLISSISEKYQDVFVNQAGDMLNLCSSISKTILSSYKVVWENGQLKHNTPILTEGINDFLEMKGFCASSIKKVSKNKKAPEPEPEEEWEIEEEE